MGRSFMEKFAHGATSAGAQYFQNYTREQIRSEITKDRDEYLNNLRTAAREDTQAFTSEENRLNREAQASTPQAKLAESKLADREQIQTLSKQLADAETDEEKNRIRESISMLPGGGSIGQRYIYGGSAGVFDKQEGEWMDKPQDHKNMVMKAGQVARDLYKSQLDRFGRPLKGDDKKSYKVLLTEVLGSWGEAEEGLKTPKEKPGGDEIPLDKIWGKDSGGLDILESDIQETLKSNPKWTRERLFKKFGIEL